MNSVSNKKICVYILAGGKGTRLWPFSTPETPKPFVDLGPVGRLFDATVRRAMTLSPEVVCAIAEKGLKVHCSASGASFLEEPEPKNTAPAVAIACADACRRRGEEAVVVILPADHWIPEGPDFSDTVHRLVSVCLGEKSLGVMGINPTGPETGYGYIEAGPAAGEGFRVKRFVEKPKKEDAEKMLTAGGFSWNSGMFVFPAQILKDELLRHCPGVWDAAEGWVNSGDASPYRSLKGISIDYALMEKSERVCLVPASFMWSDVGSFSSLYSLLQKDADGNACWGPGRVEACKGCLVVTRRRETLVRCLSGQAFVETAAGTLMTPLAESEGIRSGVEAILSGSDPK